MYMEGNIIFLFLQFFTEYCVYNGIPYTQGQTFNVGCEKKCRCDDASMGVINCDDR